MGSISLIAPVVGILVLAAGCDAPEAARPVRPAASTRPAEAGTKAEAAATALVPDDDSMISAATHPPPSIAALSPAERQRYQAAIEEGRRLHRAGDYVGAMEAIERALDVAPGDPRALSEQGWAALFAGRLPMAEEILRRAEEAAQDDHELKASILYNQGRVAEARDRPAEAVALYQRSLWLRPHPATYRHLVALPGGTRYVFGPQVRPLQGPYARIGELCAQERRLMPVEVSPDEEAHERGCVPDAADGLGGDAVEVPARKRLPAPWTELRFVETRPSPYSARIHAALRVDDGWYVVPDVASLSRDMPDTIERVTRLRARTEQLVAGGAAEVVLEIETSWEEVEGDAETHRVVLLCGVGSSGAPSCTGALPQATEVRRRGDEPVRWSVQWQVTPQGTLRLESEAETLDEPAAALLGEHSLVFL